MADKSNYAPATSGRGKTRIHHEARDKDAGSAARTKDNTFTASKAAGATTKPQQDFTDDEVAKMEPLQRAAYLKRKRGANPQAAAVSKMLKKE